MKLDILDYVAVSVSLVSLAVVFWELHLGRQQSKANALIQVYDINRQLLSLGFDRPELFDIIGNGAGDGDFSRPYLQMWLNQISLIFQLQSQRLFTPEQWDSLETDIGYFVSNPKARDLWPELRLFYPLPFREFLDVKVELAAGASEPEAPAA